MLRSIFLPVLLLAVVITCMGQTFQYSRGWTNGKRSSFNSPALGLNFHRDDDLLPELFDLQDGERRLEKCLFQLQHYARNPLQLHPLKYAASVRATGGMNPSSSSSSSSGSNNNNNVFANHHQSSELFEDLSAAEPSDYLKH